MTMVDKYSVNDWVKPRWWINHQCLVTACLNVRNKKGHGRNRSEGNVAGKALVKRLRITISVSTRWNLIRSLDDNSLDYATLMFNVAINDKYRKLRKKCEIESNIRIAKSTRKNFFPFSLEALNFGRLLRETQGNDIACLPLFLAIRNKTGYKKQHIQLYTSNSLSCPVMT